MRIRSRAHLALFFTSWTLVVAGSSFRKNPIVRAFVKNTAHCRDLDPARIRETAINEPLINWHAIDGEHALNAIRSTDGWAADASDRSMRRTTKILREKEGLQVLPASTAGLIALVSRHQEIGLSADRYVAILTGRKS